MIPNGNSRENDGADANKSMFPDPNRAEFNWPAHCIVIGVVMFKDCDTRSNDSIIFDNDHIGVDIPDDAEISNFHIMPDLDTSKAVKKNAHALMGGKPGGNKKQNGANAAPYISLCVEVVRDVHGVAL